MTNQKQYVLRIWNDVEPELHGPFSTPNERDQKARQLRAEDPERKHGLFKLTCTGRISIDSYMGDELG